MAKPIELLSMILDSLTEEVVFVDTEHFIRYMNLAGKKHYAQFGNIIGKSIFACHNKHSAEKIRDIFAKLQAGAEEILYSENEKHRIYMRAVRNNTGQLIGYYERYITSQK